MKRPFPDGTNFAKVAWIDVKYPKFPVAVVPGSFAQVEFVIKDSDFVQECFGCHSPVANYDFVFTNWAGVPKPGPTLWRSRQYRPFGSTW
ncbi:hypothetical protein EG832_12570 [bacterium]|nr:hypothetical protein [bacterium]